MSHVSLFHLESPPIAEILTMAGNKKKFKMVWRKKDPSKASTSAPPPPPPPWIELPRDITANILQRLGAVEILESAQKVCTTWRSVCRDPAMWRKIDMSLSADDNEDPPFDVEMMCEHAVNRSQGQLVELKMACFGTDYLLDYVAQRSGQLRCLSLAFCDDVSGEGLTEAITRLPLLEELHLFVIEVPPESIEIVGCSCPMLKSFTLNKRRFRVSEVQCDKEALAIAKTMPELRHLRLFGNTMTNDGLLAILDGCTRLESLDIRQCFYVKLEAEGDLGKRCSQHLKYLSRPEDSIADYEYDTDAEIDSFYGYPSGLSDLFSDYDEYDLDYDDFTRWDVDSDYEDFFGHVMAADLCFAGFEGFY